MSELIKKILNSKLVKFSILVVIVLGGYYFYTSRNNNQNFSIINPENRSLRQNIKIAGVVKPAESVDMAFEVPGRVTKINVKVDEVVKEGQELVVLDNKDAKARIAQAYAQVSNANALYRQAQAQLSIDQSKLDELKRGPRTEAVDLSQSKLSATRQSLVDAQRSLQLIKDKSIRDISSLLDSAQSRLQEVYVDADAAINQYCDVVFNNDQSSNPELSFTTSNQQDKILAENLRAQMNGELNALQQLSLKNIVNNEAQADASLLDASSRLLKIISFLDAVKSSLSGSISLSASDLNSYKSSVNTARSNVLNKSNLITQALNNLKTQRLTNANLISSAETVVATTKNSVSISERELQVVLSGASKEEIQAQESAVKQKKLNIDAAMANLNSAQANSLEVEAAFDKTILKAPFDGKVTKIDATPGQLVSAGNSIDKKSLVSVISNTGLQVEVNIPEVDIAKLATDNKVLITVDAYGETVSFDGVVTTIESGETIINGVPTYKTIIQFTQQDKRLKPGMTANLDITTANVEDIIAVPVKALVYENGSNYVDVLSGEDNKNKKRTKVDIGLMSSDGFVEIKSGLTIQDFVAIQP